MVKTMDHRQHFCYVYFTILDKVKDIGSSKNLKAVE